MAEAKRLAVGTGASVVVDACQICDARELDSLMFIGYLPPVNGMPSVGERPREQPAYPAELLRCRRCQLVQLGCIVDPQVLFPPSYPYTSGTTKILRENFAEQYREVMALYPLGKSDLVVDIGSNDGTLLSNYLGGGLRVHGIEPTDAGQIARRAGIQTLTSFFNGAAVDTVLAESGPAKLITACNVFAHIEDMQTVMQHLIRLLAPDGMFVSESHYLLSLLETLQYDTIYHEHLRYYSLTSLKFLLERYGLEVVHARRIPTHGGSIRVFAARKGTHAPRPSVAAILEEEASGSEALFTRFKTGVVRSKLDLLALLRDVKVQGKRVFGVGAPSRASTLINYVGLDDGVLDCVLEIKGSYKIGKYIPGTVVPVVDEAQLFEQQPDYALLLSWHIADELIPKLKQRGFRGQFIVPLPEARIVG